LYLAVFGLRELGETKIQNLDAAVSGNEKILGFEVAMDNAFFMRRRKTMRNLLAVVDCLPLGQGGASHSLPKRLAFQ
jgi:hypothetical protein